MKRGLICIYKITSPTGRIYIGQTRCFKKRLSDYRCKVIKKQIRLFASFNKYGVNAHKFEIVQGCEISELNRLERFYQIHFNVLGKKGLNCILNGYDEVPTTVSEETRLNLSKAKMGKLNPMFGKTIKESSKQLQRDKVSGANNYLSKIVLNTETGIYYDCLTEAAKSKNLIKGSLWAAITKYKVNKTGFVYA